MTAGTRVADSAMYAHLWGTAEARAILGEEGRLAAWLEVIAALARAQAAAGVIPARAAALITEHARPERIDVGYAAEQTRLSSHSMLGLIRALRAALPEDAAEYAYAGATVQDITDTATALALRGIGALAWRDLRRIEELLLEAAVTHRSTVMAGRTHGQQGSPVTFGWKAASWADEIRRHLDRLAQGAPRWLVGQLGGGTGSLVYYGAPGLEVRARFCAELGLADPGISWLSARDRIAEFGQVLALVCGTLARIGGEVYELQRPEIGELAEPAAAGTVGSITMPHKRNPEASEHLDTLARLARANASVLAEGVSAQHERDGRGWKAEWVALPEVCLLTSTALDAAIGLLAGLEVHPAVMARNLERDGGYSVSERALAALAPRLGKHRAQAELGTALAAGAGSGVTAGQALVDAGLFTTEEAAELTARPDPGACEEMTDLVVARAGHDHHAARPGRNAAGPAAEDPARGAADPARSRAPAGRCPRARRPVHQAR
jgi:adenylosuccinate lyase